MENLTFFPLYQTTCFFIPLVAPCTPLLALIDVYRRSDEKSAEQIEVELLALSKAFVERAERLGIEHDKKYRNLNGMKMMFQHVAYVASNGDHGMSAASSAMRKVYDMSNSSPEVFDLILKEFTKRYLT